MSFVEKTFRQGEVIIKEGDIGKSFFQILEGKAGVYANYGKNDPMRIAVLEEGEYFGEMAIIEEYPRSATVVAIGTVKVVEIEEDALGAYFRKNPDQIYALMKHIGSRIASMSKDYEDAEKLLKEIRDAEAAKKKSLFSKIKKHIDLYQNNKSKMTDTATDPITEEFAKFKGDKTGKTETFTKGKIFYKEGEAGSGMYILKEGSVGMYYNFRRKDELKLAEIKALNVFGEFGVITDGGRNATAVAESDGTMVEIVYPEDLENMMKTAPEKINLILRCLSYRLRRVTIEFLSLCKEITVTYNE